MISLSTLDLKSFPLGLQYLTSFVAITGTDFPALSVIQWDHDVTPAVSSVQIIPRYAQLVYVVNQ